MAERSSQLGLDDDTYDNGANAIVSREPAADSPDEVNAAEEAAATDDADAANYAENKSPAELREEITGTRREMSETISAIQEKLSVANITEQVKEQVSEQVGSAVENVKASVSEATGKASEYVSNLGRSIKQSDAAKVVGKAPVPFALMGIGLALTVVGLFRRQSSPKKPYKYRYQTDAQKQQAADSANQKSLYARAGESASNVYESVSGATGSAYEGISSAASTAYEGVSAAAGSAYKSASSAAGVSAEKLGAVGGQIREQYGHQLEENPLLVGAVAAAAGAAIGFSFPISDYENQLFGEARNNFLAKAEEAARDAYGKAQEAVAQAKEVIAEEVQKAKSESGNSRR